MNLLFAAFLLGGGPPPPDTATPLPTETWTPTASLTFTRTQTPMPSSVPTHTFSGTPSPLPTSTFTDTPPPAPSHTFTNSPTPLATQTYTETSTYTISPTPNAAPSISATFTVSATPTPLNTPVPDPTIEAGMPSWMRDPLPETQTSEGMDLYLDHVAMLDGVGYEAPAGDEEVARRHMNAAYATEHTWRRCLHLLLATVSLRQAATVETDPFHKTLLLDDAITLYGRAKALSVDGNARHGMCDLSICDDLKTQVEALLEAEE